MVFEVAGTGFPLSGHRLPQDLIDVHKMLYVNQCWCCGGSARGVQPLSHILIMYCSGATWVLRLLLNALFRCDMLRDKNHCSRAIPLSDHRLPQVPEWQKCTKVLSGYGVWGSSDRFLLAPESSSCVAKAYPKISSCCVTRAYPNIRNLFILKWWYNIGSIWHGSRTRIA